MSEHPFAGKGLFCTWLGTAPAGYKPADPRTVARRCAAAGVEWVAALVIWQEAANTTRKSRWVQGSFAETRDILANEDIRLIPWAYVVPGGALQSMALLDAACAQTGTRACILDVEAEWYGATPKQVDPYGKAIQNYELEAAFTSYGAPWYHRTLPFNAWAKVTQWGMPQAYDGGARSLGVDYPAESVKAYQNLWGDKVIPLSRAYQAKSGAPWGPTQIMDLAQRTPMPAGGIGWWDYNALRASARRWEGIAAIEIPGRS